MVVGEPPPWLEDPVRLLDHSIVEKATAENEIGDYVIERVAGEFERLYVHDLEIKIARTVALGLLPRNIQPAWEYVNTYDGHSWAQIFRGCKSKAPGPSAEVKDLRAGSYRGHLQQFIIFRLEIGNTTIVEQLPVSIVLFNQYSVCFRYVRGLVPSLLW